MAKKVKKPKEIDSYSHEEEKRKNNPPVGLVSSETDKLNGRTRYEHDPYIDPVLNWAGKTEGTSFEVQNVSLHVHERIDPKRIVAAFTNKEIGPKQISLFEQPENELPLQKAVDFYRHEQDWTNRLIAGDSLLVMNSLLQKEGMADKVQTIFIDPPYGIKYRSNFQPFVNKRNVSDSDRDKDLPREPEMIQAFRDTWDLGIHSYLTHLKDRLLLAKELLTTSGSIFVQISDENVHHVREIMDEVFGSSNFCALIAFKKTSGFSSTLIDSVYDYLVWYAKDISEVKYRQLFLQKELPTEDPNFRWLELADGTRRAMTKEERQNPAVIPPGSKIFRYDNVTSPGASAGDSSFEFRGEVFTPGANLHWKTTLKGMQGLAERKRIEKVGKQLAYVRFFEDFPFRPVQTIWDDTTTGGFGDTRYYVVQTTLKTITRCVLMTTDPGDLVFDPTCGGGTTAVASEQWGRRWITCDTSRVAIALTRQRLMTSKFDYFSLAHFEEGVRSGFKYETVPHVTLDAIGKDEPFKNETLYDRPAIDHSKVRVTGPFTVEAVPSLRVKPFNGAVPQIRGTGGLLARSGETGNQKLWRDELKATGVRGVGGKTLSFSRVEPMTATKFLHAVAELLDESGKNQKAVVSFGPDYGPIEQRQIEEAIKEARSLKLAPDLVIFAAFHFDPEAAKDIDEIKWPGVQILKAQMSVDLLTSNLRKKRSSSQSYWLIGQPDVVIRNINGGQYVVEINGFDYYDPITGEVTSKGSKNIAMWFLDTDYDERSLFPDQVFFPMKDTKKDWSKLGKALKEAVNEDALKAFSGTESLPFSAGKEKKVAVKIIDDRGIESFVIQKLTQN